MVSRSPRQEKVASGASALPVTAPTIRDVASAAGVAVSTVSRALAGEPRVAAATRRRIAQIADELGYAPNHFARSMRSANTGTVGFVAPDLENPISTDYLRMAIGTAFTAGYTLLVADGQGSAQIQEAELRRLRAYHVDGLLLGRGVLQVTDTLIDFVRRGVPVEPSPWTLDTLVAAQGGVVSAYVEQAARDISAATIGYRALIAAGSRHIVYVTRATPPTELGKARLATLYEVLAESASDCEVETIRTEPPNCVAEVQRIAARWRSSIGMICANGLLTPHVLEGIRSAALTIPDDVSFLCYGDSAWHRAYLPPLSVIRDDYRADAQRSVKRLVARIEGQELPDIPPGPSEFVDRGSIRRG